MSKRYTVCVDFDGVLHSYTTPWVNARTIPDPPTPGAIEWLSQAIQKFDVAVFSTRTHQWGGRWAMMAWLKKHSGTLWYESMGHRGIEDVTFPKVKPPALVYIDDRAYRFSGSNWPTAEEIHQLRPWNRPKKGDL